MRARIRMTRRTQDVDTHFADRRRHVAQELLTVERLHHEPDEERSGARRIPRDVDRPFGFGKEGLCVGAVCAVHGNAAAPCNEADDPVLRNGCAATSQAYQHVVDPLNDDAVLRWRAQPLLCLATWTLC